ncbi:hypothetical protein KSP39_PZI001327 [Platanthera zijinensis]|uniref:Uncharacterized protein n=1 Tax=Platanthera zijinensis TaxID=2320716 RepID=A0AAP0C4A4_9ASPA
MAVGVSGFNETAYFEAYNPHPYQGGYDIVLTYGSPLPPSPTICYPISAAASSPPLNPQLPPPSVPVDPLASPEAVGRENDLPEAELGSSYGLGFRDFGLDWSLNFPPFMMAAGGNSLAGLRYDAEELRYWGQFRRAAEYIFGYSQGLGERRIGVDSLGIPIYAHRNRGSDSVHVQIEPGRTEKLNYHLESPCRVSLQCSSTYNNNREDENYKFSNLSDAFMVQEPGRTEKLNYHLESPCRISSSYGERRNEVNVYENLGIDYSTHCYGGAQNVHMEAIESSYHTLDYPEASQEVSYTDSDWELPYKGYENESNVYDVAREYEQQSHTELEPYWSSWAQYPGYHGISEDVYSGSQPQTSSLGEWSDEGKLYSSEPAFQTHHDDHSVELEPFKPTWMLNPNYYATDEEIFAL